MTTDISFRTATVADWTQVAALLTSAHLPLQGAQPHLNDFVLALRDDELIGCAGLERYGDAALLRSVAVRESERGTRVSAECGAWCCSPKPRMTTFRASASAPSRAPMRPRR